MDPVTHAAFGASCSQAIFGKYSKHIPWQAGALAALTPDLDIFIRFKNDPLSLEFWHRNFTHSLPFIPIGGLLAALCLLCFSYFRRKWKITLGAALIGFATHGLLDALTSYGTVLFWPFSELRVSWDIIAIVDPMFTIPLFFGTAWSVIYQEQKGVIIGLLCASLLLIVNTVQHHRALQSMQTFATQQKLPLTNIRAMPNLASSTSWRIIAKNNNCLLIYDAYTPFVSLSTLTSVTNAPLYSSIMGKNLTESLQQDLALFAWFTDNYVVIANKNPLALGDARYTAGNQNVYSLWGITFLPSEAHIRKLPPVWLKEKCASGE
jgi:inner membrane protein